MSIDSCVTYKGFWSDATDIIAIGDVKTNVKKMIQATKDNLYLGIEQCKTGNHLLDIDYAKK